MITEEDNKFLANLEKIKQKELRAKAREAAAARRAWLEQAEKGLTEFTS